MGDICYPYSSSRLYYRSVTARSCIDGYWNRSRFIVGRALAYDAGGSMIETLSGILRFSERKICSTITIQA